VIVGREGQREGMTAAMDSVSSSVNVQTAGSSDDPLVRAVVEEVVRYLASPTDSASPARAIAAISSLIDHTLLKADATQSEIERLCREAAEFGFATVCVNPWYVPLAARLLSGSQVKVCTVVGFPLGATLPPVKMREAEEAIKVGAREVDVVLNVGALKSQQDEQAEAELRGVVEVSHSSGAMCKVILEMCLLTQEDKVRAALLAKRAGADFVKTSTGFSTHGATAQDVALLRETVGSELGVKASGGIRTLADLQAMVSAGATRIGTSSGVKIVQQLRDAMEARPTE
jgi:deoxyribose-phosphate aldolase